jgi:hypothetical protein
MTPELAAEITEWLEIISGTLICLVILGYVLKDN